MPSVVIFCLSPWGSRIQIRYDSSNARDMLLRSPVASSRIFYLASEQWYNWSGWKSEISWKLPHWKVSWNGAQCCFPFLINCFPCQGNTGQNSPESNNNTTARKSLQEKLVRECIILSAVPNLEFPGTDQKGIDLIFALSLLAKRVLPVVKKENSYPDIIYTGWVREEWMGVGVENQG